MTEQTNKRAKLTTVTVGQRVWWADPGDDLASGLGTVVSVGLVAPHMPVDDETIIDLKMDSESEAEVLIGELWSADELPCDRCDRCAGRARDLLALGVTAHLVDDNDLYTQITDLIGDLRHLLDTIPENDGNDGWENAIERVENHYTAEVDGEDCTDECERHAHLFADNPTGGQEN